MRTLFSLICLLLLAGACAEAGENWPRFRGPGGLGIADDAELPLTWSAEDNVEWKLDLPGRGWSSPVVWGNRVFLTTAINSADSEPAKRGLYFGGNRPDAPTSEHQWRVIGLELETGRLIFDRLAHEGVPGRSRHIKNSFASETPVTDGERLYAYIGNLGLYCYDLDGELLWSRPFKPRKMRYEWGTAASPVLHGDRVYIVNDNEEQSYLLALDKRTGEEIWRVDRDEGSNWATPYVWENPLRTEIVTPGTGKTRAYDLDGNLLYEFGGASSITIAAPYSQFGLLYVSSGYILDEKKPIWAIRPGASGDITLADEESAGGHVAWRLKRAAPYNPTTLVYGSQLYVLLDRGFVTSHDAKSGAEVYGRRRLPSGRAFTASPVAAQGKLYFINEYGVTFVVKAGPEFEILATNSLADDEMCMATPAIAGNRLLIRTAERLYCIGAGDRPGRR